MTITKITFNEMASDDQRSAWDAIDSLYPGTEGDYDFGTKILTITFYAPLATVADVEIDLKAAKVEWTSYTVKEYGSWFVITVQ
jgi:hypothetical protein